MRMYVGGGCKALREGVVVAYAALAFEGHGALELMECVCTLPAGDRVDEALAPTYWALCSDYSLATTTAYESLVSFNAS